MSSEPPPLMMSLAPPPPPRHDGPTCATEPVPEHLYIDPNGLPQVADEGERFWFAMYRGEAPVPMGDESVINGAVMHVAQLYTHDTPDVVLHFYETQLDANHLQALRGLPEGPQGPLYLSFAPKKGGPMHTIILVPQRGGTLMLASVGTPKPPDQVAKTDLPMPEGASGLRVDEIRDGPSRQRDLSFQTSQDLDAVRKFYLDKLGAEGFELDAPELERGVDRGKLWRQTFHRGSQSVSVSVTGKPGKPAVVSLMWIEQNAANGAAK